jgi:hypothetical protein
MLLLLNIFEGGQHGQPFSVDTPWPSSAHERRRPSMKWRSHPNLAARPGPAVNGEQAPMVYPGKEKRGRPKASDCVLAAARIRADTRYSGSCAADDFRSADEWEAQARTKQLPSTRTEIGAGGELIDREKVGSHLVDTVAHPDYVTAEASRDRLKRSGQ